MVIERIYIKGFGKLYETSLNFSKGLNVVFGKNEAGKSTLMMFIKYMMYGMKKSQKRDVIFNPYYKYLPWDKDSFGGIIEYLLDDGKRYKIERDFQKNQTRIFDCNLNDITRNFVQERDRNINVMLQQTGITEEIFEKTCFIKQKDMVFYPDSTSALSEKLANVSNTGFDDVSYSRAREAIENAIKNCAGTDKTSKKPLDRVRKSLQECEERKNAILEMLAEKKQLEQEYEKLKQHIEYVERARLLKEIAKQTDKQKQALQDFKQKENEMAELFDKAIEIEEKIDLLNSRHSNEKQKAKYIKKSDALISLISGLFAWIALAAASTYFRVLKLEIIFRNGLLDAIIPAIIISVALMWIKRKITVDKAKSDIIAEILEQKSRLIDVYSKASGALSAEITNLETFEHHMEMLKNSIKNCINEINTQERVINNTEKELVELAELENLDELLRNKQEELKQIEFVLKNKYVKLPSLQEVEEDIKKYREAETLLLETKEALNVALEVLDEACNEIHRDFSPYLSAYMTECFSKITEGKYNTLKIDDTFMPKVVEDEGYVRPFQMLSKGTEEQMYLALRLAMSNLLSKDGESLPLMLDEPFAQFDDERFKNCVDFLKKFEESNQIIIFTCRQNEYNYLKNIGCSSITL